MHVGAELAEARQKVGLSVEGLSTKTKIKVERLIAIEQMDAEGLPTHVYLKGFLRAYAAEVQLDPDDVTQRYLAELDVVAPNYATGAPTVIAAPSPAAESAVDEFRSERDFDVDELRRPEGTPVVPPPVISDRTSSARRPRFFEEYVAPVDELDLPPSVQAVSSRRRRSSTRYVPVVLVAVIALLAGWMLGANFDAIMRRVAQTSIVARDSLVDKITTENDAQRANAPEHVAPPVRAGSNTPDATSDRTPSADAVPGDTPRGADVEPSDNRAAAKTDDASATPPSTGTRANEPSSPATDRASATDRAASATAPTTDAERAVEAKNRDVSTHDLTGRWALTNRVESSTYAPFNGMNVGFHLQLQQDGNRVTGTGQKWMENGRPLPPGSRTPISVEGTLTGGRVELTFTEGGTRRTSAGTFVLSLADDGTMQGTFASDAANAQGTSLARRMTSPPR